MLEIGPGTGNLTVKLLDRVKKVSLITYKADDNIIIYYISIGICSVFRKPQKNKVLCFENPVKHQLFTLKRLYRVKTLCIVWKHTHNNS